MPQARPNHAHNHMAALSVVLDATNNLVLHHISSGRTTIKQPPYENFNGPVASSLVATQYLSTYLHG
jgi:hypothetical protein